MVSTLRRAIALWLMVIVFGIASCGSDRDVPVVLLAEDDAKQAANPLIGAIAEVSPPERIQQLKPYLDVYEPQVRIARPDPDETLTSATVHVQLQVRDFPIYKDQTLEFGPHLHLFLDDQPHQAVYDADAPITLENLSPGTHTLRLLAVRPWGESFKNEGAYDQVTFNVFAASPQNNPDDSQPVLTFNQPQDSYGAEPILLDFHLSNAPPHLVAQTDETITDWRIRCTVNGESFVFDRWQPIYLKGFKQGKNWLRLELIDENGNLIDNALNTSIRVIDYQPGGEDSLSKLVRGDIPLAQAKVLIDPSYEPPVFKVEEQVEESEEPATATSAEPTEATPPPVSADAEPTSEPIEAPTDSTAGDIISTDELAEPDAAPEETALDAESVPPVTADDQTADVAPVAPTVPKRSNEAPESTAEPTNSETEDTAAIEDNLEAVDTSLESEATMSAPATDETDVAERDRPNLTTSETSEATTPETLSTEADVELPPSATPAVPDDAQSTDTPEAEPLEPTADSQSTADAESETLDEANVSIPAVTKSNLDGVEADDLTEDSPLMESQDTNFPEAAPALELPQSPEAADNIEDMTGPSNNSDESGNKTSPRTNLKTLEDNADLI